MVGATGFTGRLVVAELVRRRAAIRLVGRDRGRLADVLRSAPGAEVRQTAWARRDLAAALEGCAAVVACAGPFLQVGMPVVEAAIDIGAHYTDSTGEQPFIRELEQRLDSRARRAGTVLAPAFGFDYVPGDLGAAVAAEGLGPLSRVDVVYAVERADASVGTRRSAVGAIRHPGLQRVDGRLRAERLGSRRRTVETPWGRHTAGSIPGGEPITVPRHLVADTVVSYLALPGLLGPAAPGAAALGLVTRLPLVPALLDRLASRGRSGPEGAARDTRVCCTVEAQSRNGARRAMRIDGRDAYGFTARALAELAVRLRDRSIDMSGFRAPAELVAPHEFLAATGMALVEVEPSTS